MSAAGLTAYNLFRTLWPQKAINEAVMEQVPELGLFKKDPNFYEKYRRIAVGTSSPQGIAPSFSIAKGDKVASSSVEFQNFTQPLYAIFSIEGDLIRRAKSDKALLVDPIKRESSNIIKQWKLDQARYIHGNGGGSYTQCVSTTGATFTIPVKDARFFRPNQRLWAASTDGTSGSAPLASQFVTVLSVSRGATTAVITTVEASIIAVFPAMGSTPYLFRHGIFGNVLPGLEAWNPVSAPGATLFRGVDRTADTELLGGLRVDARGKTPRAAAKAAATACVDNWGNPDLYILATDDWSNLEADLDSAGSLTRTTISASPIGSMNFGIKYEAIKMVGPSGPITVVASPNAPVGVGRMLTTETWTLGSMGELLHPIDENDAEDGADAKEFRMIGDVDFYCDYPGANARVRLA